MEDAAGWLAGWWLAGSLPALFLASFCIHFRITFVGLVPPTVDWAFLSGDPCRHDTNKEMNKTQEGKLGSVKFSQCWFKLLESLTQGSLLEANLNTV